MFRQYVVYQLTSRQSWSPVTHHSKSLTTWAKSKHSFCTLCNVCLSPLFYWELVLLPALARTSWTTAAYTSLLPALSMQTYLEWPEESIRPLNNLGRNRWSSQRKNSQMWRELEESQSLDRWGNRVQWVQLDKHSQRECKDDDNNNNNNDWSHVASLGKRSAHSVTGGLRLNTQLGVALMN